MVRANNNLAAAVWEQGGSKQVGSLCALAAEYAMSNQTVVGYGAGAQQARLRCVNSIILEPEEDL
jgi:hypothetical protein